MRGYFMSTDEETIVIDIDDRLSLTMAMAYKADHIKAKADPEIFDAAANALANSVEVVRCKDCKYSWCEPTYRGTERYCEFTADTVEDNGFCSKGERKVEE